jgi:hypothetical protein
MNFPGSWSDVSSGALFEMDVDRALNVAKHEESKQNGHAHIVIPDQLGEGNIQIPPNLEIEMGNIRSNDELDEYGQDGSAHGTIPTSATSEDESNLEAFRYFTQRRTSTLSIPIPNRKSHLIYRRHQTL